MMSIIDLNSIVIQSLFSRKHYKMLRLTKKREEKYILVEFPIIDFKIKIFALFIFLNIMISILYNFGFLLLKKAISNNSVLEKKCDIPFNESKLFLKFEESRTKYNWKAWII